MIVELISTGSELLLGDTVNTNVSWLAQSLNRLGYTIAYQSTVGDNRGRMAHVFQQAATRADIIISTGGLGPTQGDITREVLANVVNRPIVFHPQAMNEVQRFFYKQNRPVPTSSRREAMLPDGATILLNPVGVAPGVVVEDGDTTYILLPGPPGEMKAMFNDSVVPYLTKRFHSQGIVHSHRYAIYNMRESELESVLMDLVRDQSNPTIAMLIKKGYIELRITAKADSLEAAEALLAPWSKIIQQRLGDHVGHTLDQSISELVGQVLRDKGASVSTAESCTGGLVGSSLVDIPGSSEYYLGGVISYSNDVKRNVLGVQQSDLDAHGAVSDVVAKAMAEGTKRVCGADYGVSTTGVAGPGGGTEEKPVGLVWFGIAGPAGTVAKKQIFIGNREEIRRSAAQAALYYLYNYMKETKHGTNDTK